MWTPRLAALFLVAWLSALSIGDEIPPTPALELQEAVREAVATAAPWTVRIEALGGSRVGTGPLFGEEDEERPDTFHAALNATTTGVIVRSDGLLITSSFNLQTNPRVLTVVLSDGREFIARVVAKDESRALALLAIDAKDLPTPEPLSTSEIEVGAWALALGRTFSGGPTPTANLGIVSAKGRMGGRAIQADASINPSNYGGPLVDIRGRAMGILVPLSDESSPSAVELYDSGIGFAIPIEEVLALVPRLESGRSLSPGFLGIRADDTFPGPGVRVAEVLPDTPAQKAGFVAGDIVLTVDGQGVTQLSSLQRTLGQRFAGDSVEIGITRDDKQVTIKVELGERP